MTKKTAIPLISAAVIGAFAGGIFVSNLFSSDTPKDTFAWEQTAQQESDAAQNQDGENSEYVSQSKMKGTYYCWSYNVAGVGGKCSSPPIVLNTDGTYSISSEKGTYTITGDQIVFSESKIRGPGTFQENQKQITFTYIYNGQETTVTYLNYDDPENNEGDMVSVKLTVIFPEGDDRPGWLSVISLTEGTEIYDALCQSDGQQTIVAEYRSVKNGTQYNVTAGGEVIGTVDLTTANGSAEFTIYVEGEAATDVSASEEEPEETTHAAAPEQSTATASSSSSSSTSSTSTQTTETTQNSTPSSTAQTSGTSVQSSKSSTTITNTDTEENSAPDTTDSSSSTSSTDSTDTESSTYIPPTTESDEEDSVTSSSIDDSSSSYTPPVEEEPEEESSPYAGQPCDPNIPHYSQPGCIDE